MSTTYIPFTIPCQLESGAVIHVDPLVHATTIIHAKSMRDRNMPLSRNAPTLSDICERYEIDACWHNWTDVVRYLEFFREDLDEWIAAAKCDGSHTEIA